LLLIGLTCGILLLLGRYAVAPGRPVLFWDGAAGGDGNSQNFLDWYSLMHLTYGLMWAGILWRTSRHWPMGWLLVVSLVAAAGWEIPENTSFIIQHFADSGADPTYRGDTLLNAVGDMLCVMAGCWLGFRLGWKWGLALGLAIEVLLALVIHDSLLIGAVMLFYPLKAVQAWRMAA
jgi:hypothetical protein